ncbi:MAG: anti-anti-sigma regulatory factor (antagonist of anti-sigma factor) [Rhodocyclaceae bacterium]|nr:anti-anti-sigma regulatory factor (antagonist of anti-sigma factor) [Rhodocyclaceae bacterium]
MRNVNIEDTQSGRRFRMEGGMTVYSAFHFRDAVLAAIPDYGHLEVDLSGVQEMDVAGLQVMLQLKTKCPTTLRFTNYSPAVREVLRYCKLLKYFSDPVPVEEGPRAFS